jgi:hypothetical protein
VQLQPGIPIPCPRLGCVPPEATLIPQTRVSGGLGLRRLLLPAQLPSHLLGVISTSETFWGGRALAARLADRSMTFDGLAMGLGESLVRSPISGCPVAGWAENESVDSTGRSMGEFFRGVLCTLSASVILNTLL